MVDDILIRYIREEDLSQVAELHIRAFSESALSKLGVEIVQRYYRWQLLGPHDCLSIVAVKDEKIIAFCFSGVFKSSLGGFLQKNRNYLFQRVIMRPWLLFNELFRERTLVALKSLKVFPRKKMGNLPEISEKKRSYGILAIAVDPQIQTKGVGRLLMEVAENDARLKEFPQMHLTVNPKNTQAVNFYHKLGWMKNGEPWQGSMVKALK